MKNTFLTTIAILLCLTGFTATAAVQCQTVDLETKMQYVQCNASLNSKNVDVIKAFANARVNSRTMARPGPPGMVLHCTFLKVLNSQAFYSCVTNLPLNVLPKRVNL